MIGVGITTRNRRPELLATLPRWFSMVEDGLRIKFVIVDDASDEPLQDFRSLAPGNDVHVARNPYRLGVAMSKNRCIERLMEWGCTDLFLADDDIYPVSPDWWKPYVNSPEPHLSYQWTSKAPWKEEHRDDQHWSIRFPRGVMLYTHRDVVMEVGGMDPAHGVWGGEHVEWSQRIHDAGLTTWPYADVVGSDKLWYAKDQHQGNTVGSTVDLSDRRVLSRRNGVQWGKNGTEFIPYKLGDYSRQPIVKGPHIMPPRGHETDHYWLLEHVLSLQPHGIALEFGVGGGTSLRKIGATMKAVAFDSFEGLPEDWRPEFPKGSFKFDVPIDILTGYPDVALERGLFEHTLPQLVPWMFPGEVGLVHIDCDLYSSTKTVLDHIGRLLVPGTYCVFDEFWDYEGHEQHEMKAWKEFAMTHAIGWTVVGHHNESWAIRIV